MCLWFKTSHQRIALNLKTRYALMVQYSNLVGKSISITFIFMDKSITIVTDRNKCINIKKTWSLLLFFHLTKN